MMQNNRLWLLMARRLSGEATSSEQEELQQFLDQHPDKQYLHELLHSYFHAHPFGDANIAISDTDFDERFFKTQPEAPGIEDDLEPTSNTGRLRRIRFLRVAAAVTGILVAGWGGYRLLHPAKAAIPTQTFANNEVTAKPGARTRLVLPDGSQVWLNSGSRLNYAGDFNVQTREVSLEGEAFFEVAKDVQHPFIVHADAIDVKVLGTAFTVRSYPQDETTETTLLRGAIEVSRKDNPSTPRVILKPNEKLILSKHLPLQPETDVVAGKQNTVLSTPAPDIVIAAIANNIPDSNKEETSWMYNKLVFNGESFKQLAEKMERWYNVKIIFKDEALYNYHFGGAFVNESVEEALNALQLTAPFRYTIKNNEIELYEK